MKQVTINKLELLRILQINRAEHQRIYDEAFEQFKSTLAGTLEQLLQEVSEGKVPDYSRELGNVAKPECHVKEYDRAIKMLEMEVNPTVELGAAQFASLVDDEWEWSRRWAISNRMYTQHEKVTKFLGDDY